MTPADIALARRAVAAPGWRWMAGMRAVWPDGAGERVTEWSAGITHDGALPDLTDPATLGCLLALVRERWGANVSVVTADGRWVVVEGICSSLLYDGRYFCGDTEAEALIAALEAPHV